MGIGEEEAAAVAMDAALDQLVAMYKRKLTSGQGISVHQVFDGLELSMGIDVSKPLDPEQAGGLLCILATALLRLAKA